MQGANVATVNVAIAGHTTPIVNHNNHQAPPPPTTTQEFEMASVSVVPDGECSLKIIIYQ